MKNFQHYILIFFILPLASCNEISAQKAQVPPGSKEFKAYWYAGDAELSRYELEQARYGEIHNGDAVLIFVTEDFNTKDQVKHERGDRNNTASVLKLNATRKFFTGIYPYSMMSSTFTPVDNSSTIKVTTSSQEWCGHTFSQLNLKKNGYHGKLHSYFQSEGDQDFALEKALLEDEIWTKIRLNPDALPTGEIKLIPGTVFLRLKHEEFKVEDAKAVLESIRDSKLSDLELKKYSISYKNLNRKLEIIFEAVFPYAILAWEEEISSGFGANAKTLTTKAIRTHTLKSAYWGQHNLEHSFLRKKLGLE